MAWKGECYRAGAQAKSEGPTCGVRGGRMRNLVCSNSILSIIIPMWMLECYFRFEAASISDQIPVVLNCSFIV